MNTQTMISVKMNSALKQSAQKTAAEFGLPLGTIINSFLRQMVREKAFALTLSTAPSAFLRKIIASSEEELSSIKKSRAKSLKTMFAALDR